MHNYDIFDSPFNSFEFDEDILSKIDAEVQKNDLKKAKDCGALKENNSTKEKKSENFRRKCVNEMVKNKKELYYDLPLSLDDLNDSEFSEATKGHKQLTLKISEQVTSTEKKGKELLTNGFVDCLSPIQGGLSINSNNHSFSSTPIKNDNNSPSDLKKKEKENSGIDEIKSKKIEYVYMDADLFEDWDNEDFCHVAQGQKSMITLSQTLKLIDEAENAKKLKKVECNDDLNLSIDLLTGEVIRAEVEESKELFAESFNLSKVEDKKLCKSLNIENELELCSQVNSDVKIKKSEVVISEGKCHNGDAKLKNKPSAVQKLKFEDKDLSNEISIVFEKKKPTDASNISFGSDDCFDDILSEVALLDDLTKNFNTISKPKDNILSDFIKPGVSARDSSDESVTGKNYVTPLKEDNGSELSDSSFKLDKKRGKYFKIDESDVTEDSPSPKFTRQVKKVQTRRWSDSSEDTAVKQFVDFEAELSDGDEVSSDEEEEEDDKFEESFVDDESYLTQNCEANMTAKYLESVKTINSCSGAFKIPALQPYNPVEIFSQFQADTSTDYEIDSFCVNEVEEEEESVLHDLEVAEQVLEMDRKKRKKRRETLLSKKTKRS